ncbi:MAG TPA: sortase [Methylomirabilota bacterium]|nr:sortase [Methylomirabilota bacterium]
MKTLRIVTAIVIVAGLGLTGRATYLHAKADLAGILIWRAWDETRKTGESHAPWAGADFRPAARLQIPRLKYDELVLDNAAARTLAFGPGLMGNGVRPGQRGNLVVAGHRTSWFRPLERIAVGDQVELEWFEGREKRKREYEVEKIAVVPPDEVELLQAGEADELTMVTCYPFGYGARSPERFVVKAKVRK